MGTSTRSRPLPVRASDPTDACCSGPAAPPALDEPRTAALADRLKALADPTRLRIVDLLSQQGAPLCVCDITPQFDQHQPTISHHLRILRQAGLIDGEKRGVWSYYWATEAGKRYVATLNALM